MAKRPRTVARPLWRGHLKLSLVSCPVALINAISESEDIHFNFLNPETGNRIKYQVIDAGTEEVVSRADLVRGYQFQKDRYVTVTDEELDELKIDSSSVMNVEEFVAAEDVPPIYFERAYYLVPDGEAGEEAYAVIRDAMSKSNVFAITRAVISRKERVLALKPSGKGIVGYALREQSDIKSEKEIFADIGADKADKGALDIALKLVEQKVSKFEPAKFDDRFEHRIRDLIKAKLEGVELEPEEVEEAPNVVNLMDALRQSLKGGRGAAASERKGATIHKLQTKRKASKAHKPAKGRRAS